jgi:hypothetical protein
MLIEIQILAWESTKTVMGLNMILKIISMLKKKKIMTLSKEDLSTFILPSKIFHVHKTIQADSWSIGHIILVSSPRKENLSLLVQFKILNLF